MTQSRTHPEQHRESGHRREPEPEQTQPPRTPPPARPYSPPAAPGIIGTIVSDRNLIDELRQIYQMTQRHKPVPPGATLNQALLDALNQCADIAEKAVTAYKG